MKVNCKFFQPKAQTIPLVPETGQKATQAMQNEFSAQPWAPQGHLQLQQDSRTRHSRLAGRQRTKWSSAPCVRE